MIAFAAGPDAELAYVKAAIAEAFRRRLGRSPNRSNPEAWSAQHYSRAALEALAAELVAIDAQPRDGTFESVFEVHDR